MAGKTTYTDTVADEICSRVARGESIVDISQDDFMPSQSTIYKWLDENTQFSERYARAREVQADKLADEIVSIADNAPTVDTSEAINRARLKIDARKWKASKLSPKKYGDKVTNEHTGADGKSLPFMPFVAVAPKGNGETN